MNTLHRTDRLLDCTICYNQVGRCYRCERLHAVGCLVDAIHLMPFRIPGTGMGIVPGPQALDALDAVAFLLIDRGQLKRMAHGLTTLRLNEPY